ncbi:hypothetical protein AB0M68_03760 [Streptomyces sp. NPDC051453]|uniref:hypothetical protein n=1 Tax=Streptomyces sp. NPDC051453 TaxID=3154941 RepID=UPI00343B0BB0
MTPAEELRAAAQTLRDVAPEITGRLAGLADPVADWLDTAADYADRWPPDHQANSPFRRDALAVARTINGTA